VRSTMELRDRSILITDWGAFQRKNFSLKKYLKHAVSLWPLDITTVFGRGVLEEVAHEFILPLMPCVEKWTGMGGYFLQETTITTAARKFRSHHAYYVQNSSEVKVMGPEQFPFLRKLEWQGPGKHSINSDSRFLTSVVLICALHLEELVLDECYLFPMSFLAQCLSSPNLKHLSTLCSLVHKQSRGEARPRRRSERY
jgi:hypothetical protein